MCFVFWNCLFIKRTSSQNLFVYLVRSVKTDFMFSITVPIFGLRRLTSPSYLPSRPLTWNCSFENETKILKHNTTIQGNQSHSELLSHRFFVYLVVPIVRELFDAQTGRVGIFLSWFFANQEFQRKRKTKFGFSS